MRVGGLIFWFLFIHLFCTSLWAPFVYFMYDLGCHLGAFILI